MLRRPPRTTRTDTLFPYTTLFRSKDADTVRFQLDPGNLPPLTEAQKAELDALQAMPDSGIDYRPSRPEAAILVILENTSRSEEHTSELQSLMRISYAVFCLKKTQHTLSNTLPTHQSTRSIKT